MVKDSLVKEKNYAEITRLTAEAVNLVKKQITGGF